MADFDMTDLPEDLKPVGQKLQRLGYGFSKKPQFGPDVYGLSYPPVPGSSGSPQMTLVPRSAMKRLFYEAVNAAFPGAFMLKMADPRWGNLIYGRGANFSRMAWAGCGPTSFAIIMNYLLRTNPAGSNIGPTSRILPTLKSFDPETLIRDDLSALNHYENTKDLVLDIIEWAGADPRIRPSPNAAGKLSGTSGLALAENVKHRFQGFNAEVIRDSSRAVTLLKQGNLLMIGGRQRGWTSREALIEHPNHPDANQYDAHFVVLWGADDELVNYRQILWVLDPANYRGDKAIRYTTLDEHPNKSFIYIYRDPSKNLADCLVA